MRVTACLSGWMLKLPIVWWMSYRFVSFFFFSHVIKFTIRTVEGSSSRSILALVDSFSNKWSALMVVGDGLLFC